MFKRTCLVAILVIVGLVILALAVSTKSAFTTGAWQVDARHSDAQLVTDGTTDYGKTKIDVTLGLARVNGRVEFNDADPSKSSVVFRIYPAAAMAPPIEEDGSFKNRWLENMANHTLVCFHSKKVAKTSDGKLETTGDLTLTRVDRNVVELTPNEAYSGPVYGPPIIHRLSHETTFVFDSR